MFYLGSEIMKIYIKYNGFVPLLPQKVAKVYVNYSILLAIKGDLFISSNFAQIGLEGYIFNENQVLD